MYTLIQSINWSQPYIQYVPVTAGVGLEPAFSTASIIRNSFLSAPIAWPWNRAESSGTAVTSANQDYTIALTDFGFLETATLTDANGKVHTIKDVMNSAPIGYSPTDKTARPNAIAVMAITPGTSVKVRLLSVPDQSYTLRLTYQKASLSFVVDSATSVSAGSPAVYHGTFDTTNYPSGAFLYVTGFATAGNNGVFPITTSTSSTISVTNAGAVNETPATPASVANVSWSPIPDHYMDVYNNLFLSEMLSFTDDPGRAQMYRQRGVARFLAKADGLNEMQKNAWMQIWLARNNESLTTPERAQQGTQGRGV